MTKLCYKKGGIVKKYDLKDSANKPRLAVKSGGVTKYLGLKHGTKSGELQIKLGGQTYYVQTWGQDDSTYWNLSAAPEKGCEGIAGDTTYGGCAVWTLKNADGYLVAAIGRLAADRPDSWAVGLWVANKKVVTINTTAHAGYAKPYIRIATVPFGMGTYSQWKPTNTPADIYSKLTSSSYTVDGFSKKVYLSDISGLKNTSDLSYNSLYSCGASTINRVLTNEEVAAGKDFVGGITNYEANWLGFSISCGITSTIPIGMPYISMGGVGDGGGKRYVIRSDHVDIADIFFAPCWGVRDFYIEWPQVQKLNVTPNQVLNAWKTILTAEETWSTSFGTVYGRNY